MVENDKKAPAYWLWLIVGLGLLLRALFVLKGAGIYYGAAPGAVFFTGDSPSYMRSFENLLHHGTYSFDFLEPDAAFGRLPGYPFFYGLHYLLVGPAHAVVATVWSQVLLDTAAIGLVFSIVRRLLAARPVQPAWGRWLPYLGALLYATYPFAITFVVLIATETLATFLTLAWLAWLLRDGRTAGHFAGLALLLLAAFYVREYLGILAPISLLYLWAAYRPAVGAAGAAGRPAVGRWAALLLVGGLFGVGYAVWPLRNYASFHRVVLLKTTTAGYANYHEDFTSYRRWVLSWTNDEQQWIDKAINGTAAEFPADIFASPAEVAAARQGVARAAACGSSFYLWQQGPAIGGDPLKYAAVRQTPRFRNNCNAEVAATFQQLQASFQARQPVRYWLAVPGQNLLKAFFKSAKQTDGSGGVKVLLTRALFGWRTLLVLLGWAGVLLSWRRPQFWPVGLFAGFMYLFVCFVMRNLEMRYLLQADVLLLPVAPVALGLLGQRLGAARPAAPAAPGRAS